ncbi:uncharacterized protein LOC127851176 [Dreissena polymorpha]|uniref:Uncharacterized protein n=1 Tax=Dreissena polymorpha TaxID=45954 RepID=A0A9D4DAL4_DREPO|nr:uncharacterized protein LOC127851176 [Dreissena polymorpha]XP_052240761.1 uncharacterized protein LOC127851176 [Dreissena polymorpha]XP_052240762.1 uncharacterized protein LOC127851176 [Dreissena polymorpha]XP_052240763.1 uncharacterized protein LOC127851176 [Dreissena polymorpha]KAH3740856.1 hypothetical protein DPMN_047570 [Dreissena polymorpha]
MNGKRGRSKEATVQRSEYSDDILRNNQRSGNRLKIDMTYYDRAQKVIMKDLGKESLLLQSKLENDRKTLSLGLYGSQYVTSGPKSSRQLTQSRSSSLITSSSPLRQTQHSISRTETKFPWDKEKNKGSSVGTDVAVSGMSSSTTKSSALKHSASAPYGLNRPPADDFLASILNEALNDELLYTQRVTASSPNKVESLPSKSRTSATSHRKTKTPRHRSTPSDSIVNALANAALESDEVIY